MHNPFAAYDTLPPDPIFFISEEAASDQRTEKVDLTIGIYKTVDLESMIFKSVKEAEKNLFTLESNKDYLPISGDYSLVQASIELVFGQDHCERQLCGIQALGGTGALSLGAQLLSETMKGPVYLSDPTWVNHHNIFSKAGFTIKSYPYYDKERQQLDMDGFCHSLNTAPKGCIVVFHGCCHNPSGVDPSFEQWKELSDLCKARQIVPFFDLAYQGFGQGLHEDVKAIRLFAKEGHPLLVAQSFSKNLGLYGERVGTLLVAAPEDEGAFTHLKAIARSTYSNPPRHGALVASSVLLDKDLRQNWETELTLIRQRITQMRAKLVETLSTACPNYDFQYLADRNGMFSYLNLSKDQIVALKEKAIYLTSSGRMNVTGLNDQNIGYVAESIASVLG